MPTVEKPNTEFNLSALDVFDDRKKNLILNGGKSDLRSMFTMSAQLKAVADTIRLFNTGLTLNKAVKSISEKLKCGAPTLYTWIRNTSKEELQAYSEYIREPLVINNPPQSLGVHSFKVKVSSISSLALDGEPPEPKRSYTRSNKKVMDSELKVSFCPCCGTDIEAVRIALTLAQ